LILVKPRTERLAGGRAAIVVVVRATPQAAGSTVVHNSEITNRPLPALKCAPSVR